MKLAGRKRLAVWAAMGAGSLALAGCGNASSSSSQAAGQTSAVQPTHAQKARQTSSGGNADVGSASVQTAAAARRHSARARIVVGRAGKVQKARQTPGSTDDEVSATGALTANPCSLVSLSEARNITRGLVKGSNMAPLGPTCIFREPNAKNDITLVVETLSATQVARQMHIPAKLKVAGHSAYCGRLGMQMLFVQLPGGRSLNVTAPCPVAKRFAAAALKRMSA